MRGVTFAARINIGLVQHGVQHLELILNALNLVGRKFAFTTETKMAIIFNGLWSLCLSTKPVTNSFEQAKYEMLWTLIHSMATLHAWAQFHILLFDNSTVEPSGHFFLLDKARR